MFPLLCAICVYANYVSLHLLEIPLALDIWPLCFQVVGKKYVRLYPASLSEELYPYSETMLCNSSQVTPVEQFL